METEMKEINENLAKLVIDINMIKRKMLLARDPEGELSDLAKEQLERARKNKVKIPHEEVKRQILGR